MDSGARSEWRLDLRERRVCVPALVGLLVATLVSLASTWPQTSAISD
jgi:hypothetical protein